MTPLSAPRSRLVLPVGSSSSSRIRRSLACLSTDLRKSATAHSVSASVISRPGPGGSRLHRVVERAELPPRSVGGELLPDVLLGMRRETLPKRAVAEQLREAEAERLGLGLDQVGGPVVQDLRMGAEP